MAADAEEALTAGERGVWISLVRETRLMLACWVGHHDQEDAEWFMLVTLLRLRTWPLFISDGWDAYALALLTWWHVIVTFARTGRRGRPRKPQLRPHPFLLYAQWVKPREQGRVTAVEPKIVFGTSEQIPVETISTTKVERQNLNQRQDNARLTRKTLAFSKKDVMLQAQMIVYQAYHNFVRPHLGLRQRVDEAVRGRVRRKWRRRTPAIAAGLTDHLWSLRELLTYAVA